MLLSNSAVCNKKISRFIKQQQIVGSLSNLGSKTSLSSISYFLLDLLKINEITNKVLLTRDTFMPEMNFRQLGITCIAVGNLLKTKK